MGGSPQLIQKTNSGDDLFQSRQAIKRTRGDSSMRRTQSIPAIATTVELEVAVKYSSADSEDSLDDEDDTVQKRMESFKGHPVWKRRLSASLPSGVWNDNVVMAETPKVETKSKRHSMLAEISDVEINEFAGINSIDNTRADHEPAPLLASEDIAKEEDDVFPLPHVLQDFSIPWEEISTDFNTIVTDGAFSKSYKTRWMKAECLVTQYNKEIFSDALLFAKSQQLVKLRHPNLLQLLGFTRENENGKLLVITEQLSMTLDTVLKRKDTSELTVGPKLTIASDITKALCYLHQQSPPLVHGAVVPVNIHLTAYYSAKLSGAGFGEVAITGKAVAPSLSRYLPLEAVTDDPTLATSLDIFSFGLTLAQMVTHKEPDYRSNPADKESEKQRIINILGLIGEDHLLTDIIRRCLSIEPQERPSAVKLYNLLQTN